MPNFSKNEEVLFSAVNEIFEEKIPFNKIIGLKVRFISPEQVKLSFEMRDELIGNAIRRMLYGGVISSAIDMTAGLAAFMGFQEKMSGKPMEEKLAMIGRLSTMSLHVEYLRPALQGVCLYGIQRKNGNKVAVIRTELMNDQDELIAVGSVSYILV
jgi:acyl-coenzyme A thioesterase PaaI-like protein